MLFNKQQYRKIDDHKVLHKVHKNWIIMSTALLGLAGAGVAGAVQSPVHADTVNANASGQNQVSTRAPKNNNIKTGSSEAQNVNNSASVQKQSSQQPSSVSMFNTKPQSTNGTNSVSSENHVASNQQQEQQTGATQTPHVAQTYNYSALSDNRVNANQQAQPNQRNNRTNDDNNFHGISLGNLDNYGQPNTAKAQNTDPFTNLDGGNGTQAGNGDSPAPNNGHGAGADNNVHAGNGANNLDGAGDGGATNNDPDYPVIDHGGHHGDYGYGGYYGDFDHHDSEIAALINNEGRDNQQQLDRMQNAANDTESMYASQASANAASSAAVVSAEESGKDEEQSAALSDSAHMQSLKNSVAAVSAESSISNSISADETNYLTAVNSNQAALNNVAQDVLDSLHDNTNLSPEQYTDAIGDLHNEENSYMNAAANASNSAEWAGLGTDLNTFYNSMADKYNTTQNSNQGEELSSANAAISNAAYNLGQTLSGLDLTSDARNSLSAALSSDTAAASSAAQFEKGDSNALSGIVNSLNSGLNSVSAAGEVAATNSSTDTRQSNEARASDEDNTINARRKNTVNAINHDSKLTPLQKESMDNDVNGYANSLESEVNSREGVDPLNDDMAGINGVNGDGTNNIGGAGNYKVDEDGNIIGPNGSSEDNATRTASTEAASNLASAAKLATGTLGVNASSAVSGLNADPTLTSDQKSLDDAAVNKTLSAGNSLMNREGLIPSVVADYQRASSIISNDYYVDSSVAQSALDSTANAAVSGLNGAVKSLANQVNNDLGLAPTQKYAINSLVSGQASQIAKQIGSTVVISSITSDFKSASASLSNLAGSVENQSNWYTVNPLNPTQSAPYGYHFGANGQLLPDNFGYNNGVSQMLPGFYNEAPGYYNPYAYDNGQSPYGLPLIRYDAAEWNAEATLANERMQIANALQYDANRAQYANYVNQLNNQTFMYGARDAQNGFAGNPVLTNVPSYRSGYYAFSDGYVDGASQRGVRDNLNAQSPLFRQTYLGAYNLGRNYAMNAIHNYADSYTLGFQNSRRHLMAVDSLAAHSKRYIIGYVQGMNDRLSHNPDYLISKGGVTLHTSPDFTDQNVISNTQAGARNRASEFVVNGIATDERGDVRYHVINFGGRHLSGWITASRRDLSPTYYRSSDAKTHGNVVRVIAKTALVHHHASNWGRHAVAHLHYGDEVRIKGIVRVGSIYRFYIKRGEYLTANKRAVEWLR